MNRYATGNPPLKQCVCVRIAMAGWLHGVFVGDWLFVFPLCGFSLSLFCNYHCNNAVLLMLTLLSPKIHSMLLLFAALLFDTLALPVPRCNFWRPGYHVVQLCAGPKKNSRSVSACAAFSCRMALDPLPCLLYLTCLKVSPHTAMIFRATSSQRLQLSCMHWPLIHKASLVCIETSLQLMWTTCESHCTC